MYPDTLPVRLTYGQGNPPEPTLPIASFPHALGLGTVLLFKDHRGQFWVSYPRHSLRQGEEGQLIRYLCPVTEGFMWNNGNQWGTVEFHQCHTEDPRHPWNEGLEFPGSHRCGACGFPTWHELHGVADGYCLRCGYHG